jgi:hypothetical protein
MLDKKTLETAIEALEYYKKINYCWSASKHPKYVKCTNALNILKEELEKVRQRIGS